MHRWIRRAALLLAAACLACATAGQREPADTGLLVLWNIRSPEGAALGHLLGTVHYGRDAPRLDPAIGAALRSSHTLVLELAPADLDGARFVELMGRLGPLGGGRTLDDVLDAATRERLRQRLEALGLSYEGFRQLEPWAAMIAIQSQELETGGYAGKSGIDLTLARQAGERPVLGLETLEEQLRALAELPLDTQVELLRGVLERDDDPRASVDRFTDAWEKGDLDAIEAMAFGSDEPSLAPFYEAIYHVRNRRMAKRIARLLEEGRDPLVAIGSAHLVGADGVPALLRARGFALERVPRTP